MGSAPAEGISGRVLPPFEVEVVTPSLSDEAPAGPIEIEVGDGTGALTGTTSQIPVAGRVTFDDLVITGTGPHALTVRADGLAADHRAGAR